MSEQAKIFQINLSDGGVPKSPVRAATVTEVGLAGDRQHNLKVHGGPERALCLYSLERILALQAEGHAIYPGSIGENVTISGLDWDQVLPGRKLHLGQVVVEVTSYAAPCQSIRESFQEQAFSRVSQQKHPGWARAYVRVLRSGEIRVSDPVLLESA